MVLCLWSRCSLGWHLLLQCLCICPNQVHIFSSCPSRPVFLHPSCRAVDLYGLYQWALLHFNWLWLIGGQMSYVRVFYSLLVMAKSWLCLSPVGALSKFQLCNISSPCSLGPRGNRNFLQRLVLGHYGIPSLTFLNIVYIFVNSLFINLFLITSLSISISVSCYNKCYQLEICGSNNLHEHQGSTGHYNVLIFKIFSKACFRILYIHSNISHLFIDFEPSKGQQKRAITVRTVSMVFVRVLVQQYHVNQEHNWQKN